MNSRMRVHWLWRAGIVILCIDALLLWTVHYLPAGYPLWLYVSSAFNGILAGDPVFLESYTLASVPVPNSMLVFLVALFSHLVGYEAAGKIVLTILVVGFPLGVLAAHRALHGANGLTCAILAIPLAVSWQLFLSQNCMIGLSLIMWGLAYYGWRAGRMRAGDIGVLSGVLVLIYFSHGLSFLIASTVCVGVAFHEPGPGRRRVLALLAALLPSTVLAAWYLVGHYPVLNHAGTWSLYTVLQSAVKPLVLFMRVHGVSCPVPPTYANLPWLLGCGAVLVVGLRNASAQRTLDLRFVFPLVFCALCVLMLPDPLLGIDQPGTRFGLPLIVFTILLTGRAPLGKKWGILMVTFAAAVALYNAIFFMRFDAAARTLTEDLNCAAPERKEVYVIALDWPRVTAFPEMVSAYAGGLSGIPQMNTLDRMRAVEIPETGPVIMRAELRARYPAPLGSDLDSWASSLLASYLLLEGFSEIIVVGSTEQARKSVLHLVDRRWQVVAEKQFWCILQSPGHRTEGQR
jgi:hypothetical protein